MIQLFYQIKVTNDGVYILDSNMKKEINKTNLSPSMIDSFLQSPADWVLDKYIDPLVTKGEQLHLIRGKWYHSIMENFFALPEEERTKQNLIQCANTVTKNSEEYKNLTDNDENRLWLKTALKGYVNTWLPNANKEKVAQLFLMGEVKQGLELFVLGKIGNSNRQCLGFIDKIIEGENGLIVQDWKTGKHITDFDPTKPISENNPFGYWRQQTFYAMLLEQYGAKVEKASLLFPCAEIPQEVVIDHQSEKVRQQVIDDVEEVSRTFDECIQNNYFFPFKAGKYNKWSSWLAKKGKAVKPNIYEDKFFMIADVSELTL